MKILIVRLTSFGDITQILPIISDIKYYYPKSEIHWCVDTIYMDLLKIDSRIHRIVPIPLRTFKKRFLSLNSWVNLIRAYINLRQDRYDYIIDTHGLLKSSIVAYCAKGPVYGFTYSELSDKIAGILYRFRIPTHGISLYKKTQFLVAAVLKYKVPTNAPVPIYHPNILQKYGVVLMMYTSQPSKNPGDDFFMQVLKLIPEHTMCIFPVGSHYERVQVDLFIQQYKPKYYRIDYCLSYTNLAQTLRQSNCVISADTGIGHFSALLGVPTIFIYGSSDPLKSVVFSKSILVLQAQYHCVSCQKKTCKYISESLQIKSSPCYKHIDCTPIKLFFLKYFLAKR